MKLDFVALEISDFRCFTTKQLIDLAPVPGGLIFLRGRNEVEPDLGANGAGKSSIWAAVCWCLYGKTPDGLRTPDVKPWTGNGTPIVTLTIGTDQITRIGKTNGLTINGEPVGPDEPAKLIGMSFEVFTNTVLLAQGQPLFFDFSPKEKLQRLSEVLDLDRWEERSTKAGKKVRELEDLEREMLGEAVGLERVLETAREILEKAQTGQEQWEQEKKERASELQKALKEAESRLPTLQSRYDDATLALDSASTEIHGIRGTLQKEQDIVGDGKFHRAEASLEALETKIEERKKELAGLKNAKTCPTCGQPLKPKDLAKHRLELEGELVILIGNYHEKQEAVTELSEAYATRQKRRGEAQKAYVGFQLKVDAAQSTLRVIGPDLAKVQADVTLLKRQLAEEQSNPYAAQIQAARRSVQKTEKDYQELKEDLKKARTKLEHTKFWVKGFRDVQLYLLEEALQELEAITNVLLGEVGLIDWRVVYSVEKETKAGDTRTGLNVVIYSPHNEKPVRWEVWSGGEGQRLRLVGALALSEVLLNRAGVEPNLEVLDEPTKHLSVPGVENLCNYLADRAEATGKTIWLVDHTARQTQNFAQVVTVVKGKKGSYIELQA